VQKEAFRQYFLRGNISFGSEEESYRCLITDCKVFAQRHAAVYKYYQQLKGCNNITLVDIGGYTVDNRTFHDFKVGRGSCASLRMGTITLFNAKRRIGGGAEAFLLTFTNLIIRAKDGGIEYEEHHGEDRCEILRGYF
jgi:hypothetical protein